MPNLVLRSLVLATAAERRRVRRWQEREREIGDSLREEGNMVVLLWMLVGPKSTLEGEGERRTGEPGGDADAEE